MNVLVLGAGASKSYGDSPTGCRMPIATDFFPIFNKLDISSHPWVSVGAILNFAQVAYGMSYSDFTKADFDIEEFHSEAEARYETARRSGDEGLDLFLGFKTYTELVFLFASVINEIQNGPPSRSHRQLARSLSPNDAVITFNWDSLMERALKIETGWSIDHGYAFKPKCVFRDGWSEVEGVSAQQTSPTVLKLHGSANWLTGAPIMSTRDRSFQSTQTASPDSVFCFESATQSYDTYQGRYMDGYEEFSYGYYPPNLCDPGAKLEEDRVGIRMTPKYAWKPEGTSGRSGLVSIPLIIPPVKKKKYDSFGKLFSDLWAQAQSALTQADHIVIIGYSFPRTDHQSNALFTQSFLARSSVPRVTIVDPRPDRIADKFVVEFGIPRTQMRVYEEYWSEESEVTTWLGEASGHH